MMMKLSTARLTIQLAQRKVTFDSKESAAEATEQLNGQTLFGQQIKVNEARPKQGGGGGGGYGAPEQEEA